jgi:hypothetical protein
MPQALKGRDTRRYTTPYPAPSGLQFLWAPATQGDGQARYRSIGLALGTRIVAFQAAERYKANMKYGDAATRVVSLSILEHGQIITAHSRAPLITETPVAASLGTIISMS